MRTTRFKSRLFIFSCILMFLQLRAQHNAFNKWSIKEGLIQSDIYDICQDRRGYLWIASGGGVSIFDGQKFKHYTKPKGFPGNMARCLFEDSKGRMWIGTDEGACYFNGTNFTKITNKNYHGSSALCFAEDRQQRIYIGTDDGGLNVISFKGDSIDHVQTINDTCGLRSNSVMDMALDSQENLWLATYGGGLTYFSTSQANYTFSTISGLSKIPSDNLLCITINQDQVWIGSDNAGAFLFSRKQLLQNSLAPPNIFNIQTGYFSNYIWDILVTNDQHIWLASIGNGITRLEKSGLGFIKRQFSSKSGLSDDQIISLYEDKQQNVWIGTNGSGLNMLRGDYFSNYTTSDGLPSDKIQAIQQDSAQNYWIASSGLGLSRISFQNEQITVQNINDSQAWTKFTTCIATGKATNNNLWLGTDKNGLVKYNGKTFQNFSEKNGLINDRVYSVYVDTKGIVWVGTADGISRFDGLKFLNISTDRMKMQNEGVNAIVEDPSNYIWFATSGGIARYKGESDLRTFDEVEGLKTKSANTIASHSSGDIYIGTNGGGIYKYNHLKNDSNAIELVLTDSLLLSNAIRSLQFINDTTLIAGTYSGFDKIIFSKNMLVKKVKHFRTEDGFNGLECNDNAILRDKTNNIWFGTTNGLIRYSSALDHKPAYRPQVNITNVQLFFKDINWAQSEHGAQTWFNVPLSLVLPHYENHITFKFQAIDLSNADNILYRFKLSGRDENWSPARKNTEETFSGIAPGNYTFMVMAKSGDGEWSNVDSLSFTINPPWYKTKLFYLFLIIIIVGGLYAYVKWRENKLIKEKAALEIIVKERTNEVVEQKHIIEEKHKEITDSINYAERIQRSFIATKDLLDAHLLDYFVYFQPKDVVSGDFYWGAELNNHQFALATADSTGHGVPGAIMSLLNITSLEKAIEHLDDPAQILNHTRKTIINRLKKDGSAEGGKDGMDCSLICFDFQNHEIHVAAANNPIWIVRLSVDDHLTPELLEIKPDKMPVGKHDRDQESFTLQTIKIFKGDLIYTLTDGFPDQFGGEKGKKFMSKNLKELLLKNSQLPMQVQKELLDATFRNWVGKGEQIDDVTVIGICVK